MSRTETHTTAQPQLVAADDTAGRILDAAVAVFAERGFKAATVGEICARARANRAAISYYHDSKENLYLLAVRRAYEACCAYSEFGARPPADLPAVERLRRFIRGMVEHHLTAADPAAMQLMMREMVQPTTPTCAEWVRDYVRPMADYLRAILTELMPAGTPESTLWQYGFSVVSQSLFYRQNQPVIALLVGPDNLGHYLDLDRVADHIARFTLAGLGLPAGQPAREGTP